MKHLICFILLCAACLPDTGPPQSRVVGPRILSIRSDPAEVFPGESVELSLVAVDGSGKMQTAPVDWAFCLRPKPPVENNVVHADCLGDGVIPIAGNSQMVMATIPDDACSLFGPDLPPPLPGMPAGRPRDPDDTGGYYQPVRVTVEGMQAIGLVRIRCGLPFATPDVAAQFRTAYIPNRNPTIAALEILDGDDAISALRIPTNRTLRLRLLIPLESREIFLRFDVSRQSLVSDPEVLRVSWLSAQGELAQSQTMARDGDNRFLYAETSWTSPSSAGSALLWTVLRDSRGGVLPQSLAVEIVAP